MSLPEPQPYCFEFQRRVEFSETDMAGIMHFSNFYRFMESAEHAFFRSLDHGIHQTIDGETVGWPRVHSSCDFFRPVRFEDSVTIRLTIEEIRRRSVRYIHTFLLGDDATVVASGRMTTACVCLDREAGKIESINIPEELREKLEKAKVTQ
ncbi:MAG: acyl-CoA thioesterase [Verrucomicrobiia bacterium]|jgi:acyl-CoA thioester hydrolase